MKNVNIAEIMEVQENKILADKLHKLLDRDVQAEKMVEKACNVEDLYEVVKRYTAMTWEDFKYALNAAIAYLAPPKLTLADTDMEYVIGGGFWGSIGNWFKENWKPVVTAIVVAAPGLIILPLCAL